MKFEKKQVLPGNDYHVRKSRFVRLHTHICMLIYLLAGCEATGIPVPDVFWSMGVDNEPIQGTE